MEKIKETFLATTMMMLYNEDYKRAECFAITADRYYPYEQIII